MNYQGMILVVFVEITLELHSNSMLRQVNSNTEAVQAKKPQETMKNF